MDLSRTEKKLIKITFLSRIILLFPFLIVLSRWDVGNSGFTDFFSRVFSYWDAGHYQFIAENWYVNSGDASNFIVFLPLFPLIIKGVNLFTSNSQISAVLVSNIFFFLSIIPFYNLAKRYFSNNYSFKATLLLLFFPTSYFFSISYTESLFLFLSVIALLEMEKRNYLKSSAFIALSLLTKHLGLVLIIVMFVKMILRKEFCFKQAKVLFLPALSVIYYLSLNAVIFNNPFAFQEILKEHWHKSFTFPWTGIASTVQLAFSFTGDARIMMFTELLAILLLIWVVIKSIKKFPIYLFCHLIVSTLIILSTGFILSTPRYLLSIPTFYYALPLLMKKGLFFKIWLSISTILGVVLLYRYMNGMWAY